MQIPSLLPPFTTNSIRLHSTSASPVMKTKLILDTDIGSDIDDAVCLAWLLREPACELLGITTVSGDVATRASLASSICHRLGRPDMPIHPGLAKPFYIPESRQPNVPQASIFAASDKKWPHTPVSAFSRHEAVHFLQRTIRQNPGEVTLLAIGPLTNIAALFTIDPEIPSLLKALVIMGGNFSPVRWHGSIAAGRGEWNIWNDPHAAEIVYRTPVRLHRSIGIDVTMRVEMDVPAVHQKFQVPGLDVVLDMARVWFDSGRPTITFHDPLAAVSIFYPDVCTYTQGRVRVVTEGLMEGFTLFDPQPAAPADAIHEVAEDVFPEKFFEKYFGHFI